MSSARQTSRKAAAPADGTSQSAQEHVKEVVHTVLACHNRRQAMKDTEIRKLLSKDHLAAAARQFRDILGCELVKEGDRQFLCNLPGMPVILESTYDQQEESKEGLLIVVLMYIFMAKNPVLENDMIKEHSLWEFLKLLEVNEEDSHKAFGLPSKLIGPSSTAEFISQGWLSFEKRKGERDNEEILYDWGPRANHVVSPMAILESFCEIVGDKAEDWKYHYKRAAKAEQDRHPH